jgi:APA family basic amino acid/polyamine antiporter
MNEPTKTLTGTGSGLLRALGLKESVGLVLGSVIGTGVFLKAAVMSQEVKSPWIVIAAWVMAGLLSFTGALTYAELGAMLPEAGGEYVYLRTAYGDILAFLYGWTQIAIVQTGAIAAFGVACATFLGSLLTLNAEFIHKTFRIFGQTIQWDLGIQQILAVGLIILFSCLNCAKVSFGARFQWFLTVAKVIGILGIIFGIFFFSSGPAWRNTLSQTESVHWPGFQAFGMAMIAALWAYNGWNLLPMTAGEVADPESNIPKALALSMGIVIFIYGLINLAYFYALSFHDVAISNSTLFPTALPVATKAAKTFLGGYGVRFASLIFILSTIGALNGVILASARIPFAMAKDKLFFSFLGTLHPRTRVPVRSISTQALWACVLALSGTFDQLTDLVVFGLWIYYALCASGVFILRYKRPELLRPYKCPGYPVIPALFVTAAAWLVLNSLLTNFRASVAGLFLIAAGLPLYLLFRYKTQTKWIAR